MTGKYGMSFDEFVSRKVVRQKEYTWDVESDAMEWETAISGMNLPAIYRIASAWFISFFLLLQAYIGYMITLLLKKTENVVI